MRIANTVLDLVGRTPMVRLHTLVSPDSGCHAEVVAKLEYFNPASSVKDRLALAMIEDAEKNGILIPHSKGHNVIVEPTSGNTGIGLAFVAAVKGYKLILTMPENMTNERKMMLKGLGAQLVLTPKEKGMTGALEEARKIVAATPGALLLQQFANAAGPLVHERTTGAEIWEDCEGKVDIFIAGIGTGGTISGVGKKLKSMNPQVRIVGVEPAESPVLSGGKAGPHLIAGIGAGFVPEVLQRDVIDSIVQVRSEDAIATAKLLIQKEGILAGISSGASAYAALELAKKPENAGKRIVFIACDTAERYLSSALFADLA